MTSGLWRLWHSARSDRSGQRGAPRVSSAATRGRSPAGIAILLLLVAGVPAGRAEGSLRAELRGQAALSLALRDEDPRFLDTSLRYAPEATARLAVGDGREITALASLDATARTEILSLSDASGETDLDAYRFWIRASTRNIEVRAGRQRLSFGAASVLRPLMWFDRVDPRDPLRITRGVDAVLLRAYLRNDGNLWGWALLAGDEPKGWEILPTTENTVELGGRLQWPAPRGEIAFTYHYRRPDASSLFPRGAPFRADPEAREHRYALDGRWDVVLGLWFEAVLVDPRHELLTLRDRRLVTVGADYTFALGPGLTALVEHLTVETGGDPFAADETSGLSAMSLRYPANVLDELRFLLYRDWEADDWFRFLEWRRAYDCWAIHWIAFANPDGAAGSPVLPASGGALAGRGGRVLFVFNH